MSMPRQRADARPAPGMICKTRSRLDKIAERAVRRIGRSDHDDPSLALALLTRWEHGPCKGQDSFEDRQQARKEAKDMVKAARAKAALAKAERRATPAKKETQPTRRLTVQHQVAAAMGRRRKSSVGVLAYPVVSTCCAMGERDSQQDRIGDFFAIGLYAIADGLGGHDDGDIAAETALATLRRSIAQSSQIDDPGVTLQLAMQAADGEVATLGASHLDRWPGTTLTALWLTQGSVWIAHCGDSRAYHVIGGAARQLTEDHGNGWGLTQCMGRMTEPQILGPLPPSGQYLLCSDGLTGTLPDEEIARVLTDSPPIAAARALVQAALAKGKRGQDNVSAIVITIGPAAEMRPAVPPMVIASAPVNATPPPAAEPVTGEVLSDEASKATQPAALAPINIQMDGEALQLWQQGGGEPLAKDLDVAAWLGYETPRQIRELIDRHAPSLGGVCRVVRQTSTKGGRPGSDNYLTREQALFIAAKSETPNATAILRRMIAVFRLATEGRLPAAVLPEAPQTKRKQLRGSCNLSLGMTGTIVMMLADKRYGTRAWVKGEDEHGHEMSVNVPGGLVQGMAEGDLVALDIAVSRSRLVRRAEAL